MPKKLTPEQKALRDAEKKEYYRRYYAAHRDEQIAASRQWRTDNPDKCVEQGKRRTGVPRTDHQKERARIAQQIYRAKHPEIVAAQLERGKILRRERYRADEVFRESMKARSRAVMPAVQRARRANLKEQVFSHYGKFCACCGETEPAFLTIGHVNGDGAAHRRSLGSKSGGPRVYLDIIRRGFPNYFRVECYNCNCGAFRNGGVCPHVRAKLVTVTPNADVATSLSPVASPETLIAASSAMS